MWHRSEETSLTDTDIKVEDDASAACRICLQQGSDSGMASIYDLDRSDSLAIYQKIELCAGLQILLDPELPARICRKCNAFLNISYKFRVICHSSDNYLREFVCKSTRIQDDEESVVPEPDCQYLVEYNSCENSTKTKVVQVLQEHEMDDTQTMLEYEELEEYSELWVNEQQGEDEEFDKDDAAKEEDFYFENEVIVDEREREHIDENSLTQSNQLPCPAAATKTLGISEDGAAVIRVKAAQHVPKERQMHICELCGNTYPRKYALEAHMRRHRNERPFECEICHTTFHLNFQLTRHMRKHTGDRPYTCIYCNRNFADRSTMVKHERIHRNERPYKCETCHKNFTYSSVLKVHMLTHTGEKPFICGICEKRFARSHHLRAHLETQLHRGDPRAKILIKQVKREEEVSKDIDSQ